jgi:hypothetical protein
LSEWPDIAITNTILISKSKLYSLLKESQKQILYIIKYLFLSFLFNEKVSLLLKKAAKKTDLPIKKPFKQMTILSRPTPL